MIDQSVADDQQTPETAEKPTLLPSQSRFLFVDIAALRAKQLRRGALPRLEKGPDDEPKPDAPRKAERVAMEEVKQGLISYHLPDLKPPTGGAGPTGGLGL